MSLGPRTKETPKPSDRVGREHTFGHKEFTLTTCSHEDRWLAHNMGRVSILAGVFVLCAMTGAGELALHYM